MVSRFRVLKFLSPELTLGMIVCLTGLFFLSLVVYTENDQASAAQSVPYRVNFQGRLTNAAGNIVTDGLYNMQFRLYDTSSTGTLLWSETRETTNRVQVTNGLFAVQLGSVSALSPSLFNNANARYLEVTMATPATATCSTASCASWESPMSPRQALASSTYALNSDLLDGQDGSYYQDASNLNAGTINTGRVSGSYTGITGTGALTVGSIGSGFGTIATGNTIQGSQLISTVATGTAPLTVFSTTLVANLNADLLDGQTGSFFQNAANLNAGTVDVSRGGTGLSSYAVGDLLFASGTGSLSRLAAVASGSCLISQGVSTAPAWGSCGVGGINGSGASGQVTYFTGAGSVTSSANLLFDGSKLTVGGDFSAGSGAGEAKITVYGGSTGSQRLDFTHGATTKWSLGSIGGGANPSFQLQRYVNGTYLDSPLSINNSNGTANFTSTVTAGKLISTISGGAYLQGGDDTTFNDVNISNTAAIIGVQDATKGCLQLGNSTSSYVCGNSGNLGIGLTSATHKLQVAGNVYSEGAVYATNWLRSVGGTGWYSETYGGGWHMIDSSYIRSYNKAVYMDQGFDTAGASGVGCGGGMGGGYTLRVCGSQQITGGAVTNGSHTFQGNIIYTNPNALSGVFLCVRSGDNVVAMGSSCTAASSARFKENVVSLTGSQAMGILSKLRAVGFDWKTGAGYTAANGGSADFGVIAEEIEQIAPHLVSKDANGQTLGVNYSGLIPILIKAVQDQQSQIAQLQGGNPIFNSLVVSGLATIEKLTVQSDARIKGDIYIEGHLVSSGGAPTIDQDFITCLDDLSIAGTDTAGTIQFRITESSCASADLRAVFAKEYVGTPHATLTAKNRDSARLKSSLDADKKNLSFSFDGLETGKSYAFTYHVIQ